MLLDKLVHQQTLMMEAYKDFLELAKELKDERGQGANSTFELPEEESEVSAIDQELAEGVEADDYAAESILAKAYEDESKEWPVQQGFDLSSLNPEDPEFWRGKEIGLPIGLVVNKGNGEGKLLPILNGLFHDTGL